VLDLGLPAWESGLLVMPTAAAAMGMHHTFLTVGGLTILSSLSFWTLQPDDGESVSRGRHAEEVA